MKKAFWGYMYIHCTTVYVWGDVTKVHVLFGGLSNALDNYFNINKFFLRGHCPCHA